MYREYCVIIPFGVFGKVQLSSKDVGNEIAVGCWTFCGAVEKMKHRFNRAKAEFAIKEEWRLRTINSTVLFWIGQLGRSRALPQQKSQPTKLQTIEHKALHWWYFWKYYHKRPQCSQLSLGLATSAREGKAVQGQGGGETANRGTPANWAIGTLWSGWSSFLPGEE